LTKSFGSVVKKAAPFWLALAGGLMLQALALYWPPLASILVTEPLSGADLARVLAMSLFARAVVETGKVLAARDCAVALDRRRFIEEALAERRDLLPGEEAVQSVRVLCERLRGFLQLL
jgi:hypothetical protein